jgi:quinol-cytochrome oxidoreductase complex cytochrome b subunit
VRSLTVCLWLLAGLALTGLALMFLYVPAAAPVSAPGRAGVTAGGVLRGLHFWAGNLIVLAVLAHLGRTAFVRASRPRLGWAAALTALTVLSCFTGYLLPWDHLAFWLLTWTHGLGGALGRMDALGALLTVYWTHTLGLTALTLPLLIAYARRARRARAAR